MPFATCNYAIIARSTWRHVTVNFTRRTLAYSFNRLAMFYTIAQILHLHVTMVTPRSCNLIGRASYKALGQLDIYSAPCNVEINFRKRTLCLTNQSMPISHKLSTRNTWLKATTCTYMCVQLCMCMLHVPQGKQVKWSQVILRLQQSFRWQGILSNR